MPKVPTSPSCASSAQPETLTAGSYLGFPSKQPVYPQDSKNVQLFCTHCPLPSVNCHQSEPNRQLECYVLWNLLSLLSINLFFGCVCVRKSVM